MTARIARGATLESVPSHIEASGGHKHLAEYMPCVRCPGDDLCRQCQADMAAQPVCYCEEIV